jgi:hypothetical protein
VAGELPRHLVISVLTEIEEMGENTAVVAGIPPAGTAGGGQRT